MGSNKSVIRILNAEPENYCDEARAILSSLGKLDEKPLSRRELLDCIDDYDVLIVRLGFQVDRELLDAAKRLRYVVTATTGLNHIDMDYAAAKGVKILCLRGQVDFLKTVRATAELTVGLAIALIRQIPRAFDSVLDGEWNRDLFRGTELYGKTAGIVGMGRLGCIVAEYFKAFGMVVKGFDPRPDFPHEYALRATTLHELLSDSDIVSLHVAYNQETHHLLGPNEFGKMKENSILINTSRGGVIDERALLQALQSKQISGAALDVLEDEPNISKDQPLLRYAREHSNLLISPHIGGNTYESFIKTEVFMAQSLLKALHNE